MGLLSKGVLDVMAITFTVLGIIIYVDWGMSGHNTYGDYCTYRNINDKYSITILFVAITILFVISVIWLIVGGIAPGAINFV